MNNILDLSNQQARKFLLKEESYFNFDLPEYFNFSKLIGKLSKKLEGKNLSDFYLIDSNNKSLRPDKFEEVNYKLLSNKNGQYAWRPFQLIHPALYVSLVDKITEKNQWETIIKKFKEFRQEPRIECLSLPIQSKTKESDKAEQVSQWWQEVEQKSIELSLDFTYVYHTDITDCYSSIYTHSIAWALHDKEIAKTCREDGNLIGNIIDKHLKSMSCGQTNGIPQGSVLMDFIAEMVLGYVDKILATKIENVEKYKIIRYRDDYRIFVNNPQDAEEIIKKLTEVLIDLGLKLNDKKTIKSDNIIRDSIKPDKLYWEISNKTKLSKNIQSKLYIISDLAERFPNSGSVSKQLYKLYQRISNRKKISENIKVLISIIVDIAFKNPRTYPIATAIISKFFSFLKSKKERKDVLERIKWKFEKLPNTGYLQIWIQRLTIKIDTTIKYEEKLCQKVKNTKVQLWNSEWLNVKLKSIIDKTEIVDNNKIEKLKPVIDSNEVALFKQYYN